MAHYVGILDGGGDVWGIRIPDVPGCHGAGSTPDTALRDATSALQEVAAHYAATGRDMPSQRTMEQVRRDENVHFDPETESFVMVPLLLESARTVSANISIDAGTLRTIDEEASRRGLTRSRFFASAAIEKIGGQKMPVNERRWATGRRSAKGREIDPHKGDERYIRRDEKGRVKESDDVGRALSQDRRRKAKTVSKAGQGHKRDRRK